MSKLEAHPLADLFPSIEGNEFSALVEDVRTNGLLDPIVLHEGMILDGRNRYRAATEAKVKVRTIDFDGPDPLAFVISKNLKRRHLSESQRAMVADKIATIRQGERTDLEPFANLRKVDQADAAKLLNVGKRSIEHARKVRTKGTAKLAKAVEDGKLSVSKAAALAFLYPEAEKGGRGKNVAARKAVETAGFSPERLKQARTIVRFSRDLAIAVRDGSRRCSRSPRGAGAGTREKRQKRTVFLGCDCPTPARRFINVYEVLGSEKSGQLSRLSNAALFQLAAPSTTPEVREAVTEKGGRRTRPGAH
jgi:ParB-like chromosome segregation protein Spo0J